LLKDEQIETLLIFTQMKHAADKLAKSLTRAGIVTEAIHGNKSQNARQNALRNFKNKKIRILVATDIAARGIDIDELTHVLNYELPNTPETYVHRIGRTGRAGASGTALSFCDWSEKMFLRDIEKLIKKAIPPMKEHPYDVTMMHGVAAAGNTSSASSFPVATMNGANRFGSRPKARRYSSR
jgi:ATP-dependent RNA helicase RhlE